MLMAERTAGADRCAEAVSPRARRVANAKLLKLLALTLAFSAFSVAGARANIPEGVWLLPAKAALQIFDCGGALCGRVVWLQQPRNRFGDLMRDIENPNPALRQRPLCGQTLLWGLRPAGADRWEGGAFYNPDDGRTYRVNAELRSTDRLVARLYLGVPLLGQNRTLLRVARLGSEASCASSGSETAQLDR